LLTPGDRLFPLRVIDGVSRGWEPLGQVTLDGLTRDAVYMSRAGERQTHQLALRHLLARRDRVQAATGHPPFDGRTLAEVVCMHNERTAAAARRCDAPVGLVS
jgi:hypothetical protein